MNEQYIMRPEASMTCEWDTFVIGTDCDRPGTQVILDTSDTTDPTYPEGFHWAHGCNQHASEMLGLAQRS